MIKKASESLKTRRACPKMIERQYLVIGFRRQVTSRRGSSSLSSPSSSPSSSSSSSPIPCDRLRKASALLAEDHHGDEDDHAPRGAERSGCWFGPDTFRLITSQYSRFDEMIHQFNVVMIMSKLVSSIHNSILRVQCGGWWTGYERAQLQWCPTNPTLNSSSYLDSWSDKLLLS